MRNWWAHLVLSLVALVAVVPFLITTLAGFKSSAEMVVGVLKLPEVWRWENFVTAWVKGNFDLFFLNSLVVAVVVVAASLPLAALAAYGFARPRFAGQGLTYALFMLGIIIPTQALVIPLYYLLRAIGLLDTLWALILPQMAQATAFSIFLLTGAFRSTPQDLTDAAMIDGANSWQGLWRVVVPLNRPTLGTVALLNFIWTWNEFLLPLVLTVKPEAQTLPVGLLHFQQRWTTNIPLTAAGATLVFLPLLVVFVIFQRQLIHGILAGALKE